jgi:hypothetical protein
MLPGVIEDRARRYRRCQSIEAMEAAFDGKTVACTVGADCPGFPFSNHREANSIDTAKAIEIEMKKAHNEPFVWWWLVEDKITPPMDA